MIRASFPELVPIAEPSFKLSYGGGGSGVCKGFLDIKRVNKQRRHRRAVRFYTACFGFLEPFKILCGGTFLHHLLANGITTADTALAKYYWCSHQYIHYQMCYCGVEKPWYAYSDLLNAARNLITVRSSV